MISHPAWKHVIEKINQAQVVEDPFPYFYIENIFPESFFKTILNLYPQENQFIPLGKTNRVGKGQYNERLMFSLEKSNVMQLSQMEFLFWKNFSDHIHSQHFTNAILERLSSYVQKRYQNKYEKLSFSTVCELLIDKTNYALGPHTDHPMRTVTCLFYLPSDDSLSHMGTSVYVPKDRSFTSDGLFHHEFKDFDKIYTAPFKPNSLFGFVRTDNSFHGVEPIKEDNVTRRLMNFFIKGS
jgi:hypothetical protein